MWFFLVAPSFVSSLLVKSYAHLLPAQAQFSQMRPVAMAPSVAPRMPMYPPGGPGLGQQIFYGQAPPAIIPSQVISDFNFLRFTLISLMVLLFIKM